MDARERAVRCAARYLGVRGEPRGATRAVLEAAYPMALEAAQQKHLIRRTPVCAAAGRLRIADALEIPSLDLCRLFDGAKEGLALVITLGAAPDVLVRRLMLTDPALGAAVGACASALVDEEIDRLLAARSGELAKEGIRLSPRFSPGYGDAPLSCQGPLLRWLEARRIGVCLTAGGLMLPEKSVTALVALLPKEDGI